MYDHYTTQAYSLGRGKQSTAKDIFVHLVYGSVQLSEVGRLTVVIGLNTQAVPNWEVPLLLVHQVYDQYTTQACSLGHGEQSAVNGIFVHLLYGSVQLS